MIGIIIYTLFIFWTCGTLAVLVDFDHIFVVFGRRPPFKLGDSYGRPFHSRVVFTLVAVFVSICMASFINGFYRTILQGIGERETLLLMISLCLVTGYVTKRIGYKIGRKLVAQRREWRKEKLENGTLDMS